MSTKKMTAGRLRDLLDECPDDAEVRVSLWRGSRALEGDVLWAEQVTVLPTSEKDVASVRVDLVAE